MLGEYVEKLSSQCSKNYLSTNKIISHLAYFLSKQFFLFFASKAIAFLDCLIFHKHSNAFFRLLAVFDLFYNFCQYCFL